MLHWRWQQNDTHLDAHVLLQGILMFLFPFFLTMLALAISLLPQPYRHANGIG